MTPVSTSKRPVELNENVALAVVSSESAALSNDSTGIRAALANLHASLSPPDIQAVVSRTVPQEAETSEDEANSLAQRLAEEKRMQLLQRANVEQARRVTECLLTFHEILLENLAQPCFLLDTSCHVLRWNRAMARWSGLSSSEVLELPISRIFPEEIFLPIQAHLRELKAASSSLPCDATGWMPVRQGVFLSGAGHTAVLYTLLPLSRIPGHIEKILLLLEPQEV